LCCTIRECYVGIYINMIKNNIIYIYIYRERVSREWSREVMVSRKGN